MNSERSICLIHTYLIYGITDITIDGQIFNESLNLSHVFEKLILLQSTNFYSHLN